MQRPRATAVKPISHLPGSSPQLVVNAQTWQHLTFLHWQVPVQQVQGLLPRGLFVDTHDGQTWLGVVPFAMGDVRLPPLPAVGRCSNFSELNVRVYVHDHDGNRGVWFLGLWCASTPFVIMTRALGVPYHRATGRITTPHGCEGELSYRFIRSGAKNITSNVYFEATVQAGAVVQSSSSLEAWLTARWNMFAMRAGMLWRYPVHHEPWQLQEATALGIVTNIHERFGFAVPSAQPLVHTAKPVHTLVSPPKMVRC